MTRIVILQVSIAMLFTGCMLTPSHPVSHPARTQVLGMSLQQRPIEAYVYGQGESTVLLLGSIHGSEPAGALLCDQLLLRLQPHHYRDRRMIVIPRPNPDGLSAGRRTNSNKVDLNRNFPSANFRPTPGKVGSPLSEPETRALHQLVLSTRPALVITIHQPLALVDYDGPAQKLAARLSRQIHLPLRRLGGKPGSLGSWVGNDLGIPIITLELPRSLPPGDALWHTYGPPILRLISTAPLADSDNSINSPVSPYSQ